MDLMVSLATQVIGPAAFASMIARNHEVQWQEEEIAWLCDTKGHLSQPVPHDGGAVNSDQISRCPGYFSADICGATPSKKYFMYELCQFVESKRTYFHAEIIKQCHSSKNVIFMQALREERD